MKKAGPKCFYTTNQHNKISYLNTVNLLNKSNYIKATNPLKPNIHASSGTPSPLNFDLYQFIPDHSSLMN